MSFSYFNKLNYSLANEDTTFEYHIMEPNLRHIVSVAGSGGRVIPLLASQPKNLTCVDLSAEQLYLTEFRIEACRQLAYEDYVKLLGYETIDAEERRRIFASLSLSEKSREFIEGVFTELQFESLLYIGKWEKTFSKLSKLNRLFTGQAGAGIFNCKTLEEQREYFMTRFPRRRFQFVVYILGNASIFNALLYKGHFVRKNVEWSHKAYYQMAFDHLFSHTLLRENYFMQILFFGEIKYKEAWLIEANPKVFAEAKAALAHCQVRYEQGNLLDTVQRLGGNIDFLGLSDVPSYFSDSVEKDFMQIIRPNMSIGGRVAIRSYLRIPFRPNLKGYENISPDFDTYARQEKTAMYFIDIYKRLT